MSREAMKLALEALDLLAKWENPSTKWQVRKPKDGGPIVTIYPHKVATDAAIALRQALETEQEPVAWRWKERINGDFDNWVVTFSEPPPYAVEQQPLYTAPPKREWVGLTADEIWKCNRAKSGSAVEFHICYAHQNVLDFAESIEAKLREKNT